LPGKKLRQEDHAREAGANAHAPWQGDGEASARGEVRAAKPRVDRERSLLDSSGGILSRRERIVSAPSCATDENADAAPGAEVGSGA